MDPLSAAQFIKEILFAFDNAIKNNKSMQENLRKLQLRYAGLESKFVALNMRATPAQKANIDDVATEIKDLLLKLAARKSRFSMFKDLFGQFANDRGAVQHLEDLNAADGRLTQLLNDSAQIASAEVHNTQLAHLDAIVNENARQFWQKNFQLKSSTGWDKFQTKLRYTCRDDNITPDIEPKDPRTQKLYNDLFEALKSAFGNKDEVIDINEYNDVTRQKTIIEVLCDLAVQQCFDLANFSVIPNLTLDAAVTKGHLDVVQKLMSSGDADPNKVDAAGMTPFLSAVKQNHTEIAMVLFDKANLDLLTPDKNTALTLASMNGNLKIVQAICDSKRHRVRTTNGEGLTALHVAKTAEVALYLTKFTPVDIVEESHGMTPLMKALSADPKRIDVALALINKACADLKVTTKNGETALHWAAVSGSVEAVQALLDKNIDVNAVNSFGHTAFWHAAGSGNVEVVRLLAKVGSNINHRASNGATPLYYAAQNGFLEVVQELIKMKADVNQGNQSGTTPLIVASENGQIGILHELIQANANVNGKSSKGLTPILMAVQNNQVNVLEKLIKSGADLKTTDKDGLTLLMVAATQGHLDIVEDLVIAHKVNAKDRTPNGRMAIHYAATSGHREVIKFLVEKGSDVNQIDKEGNTPLMVAVKTNQIESVHQLMGMGAKLNEVASNGMSALHYAVYYANLPIMEALLAKGASIDRDDVTEIAQRHGPKSAEVVQAYDSRVTACA